MAGFDVSWTEIVKFFQLPTLIFCSFLDSVEIIVNKSVSGKKSRGHRTSKIVKSTQSCSNGHLPYHLFILLLSARAHVWRGMRICVRSKDAQKQLARTSLSETFPLFGNWTLCPRESTLLILDQKLSRKGKIKLAQLGWLVIYPTRKTVLDHISKQWGKSWK